MKNNREQSRPPRLKQNKVKKTNKMEKVEFIQHAQENDISLTISLNANDLISFGEYLLNKASRETAEAKQQPTKDDYLLIDEVMQILDIKSKSTLYRWDVRGYLKPSKIGRKLVYKKSDIDRILNKNH